MPAKSGARYITRHTRSGRVRQQGVDEGLLRFKQLSRRTRTKAFCSILYSRLHGQNHAVASDRDGHYRITRLFL